MFRISEQNLLYEPETFRFNEHKDQLDYKDQFNTKDNIFVNENISYMNKDSNLYPKKTIKQKVEDHKKSMRKQYLHEYFKKKRIQNFNLSTQPIHPDPTYPPSQYLIQTLIQTQSQQVFKFQSFNQFYWFVLVESIKEIRRLQQDGRIIRKFREYVEVGIAREVEKMMVELDTIEGKAGWKAKEILQMLICKLVDQVVMLVAPSSIYHTPQNTSHLNIPLFSGAQQLQFLLKILIEITYYDNSSDQTSNVSQFEFQKSYEKIIVQNNEQRSTNNLLKHTKINFNITQYLVENTELFRHLKFYIAFGIESSSELAQHQNTQINKRSSKIKQTILKLIVTLCQNISSNIGSDCLFQQGIVSEIVLVLNQPLFVFNIRRNKVNQNKISNNSDDRPKYHSYIQNLLIRSFQKIKRSENLVYLREMDSFQLVIDWLQQIMLKRRQTQTLHSQPNYSIIGNQILLVDQCPILSNESYQPFQSFQQSQQYQLFIKSCVDCLYYHFRIGQYYLRQENSSFQREDNFNHLDNFHLFTNPYIVKFRHILNAREIINSFQAGRQMIRLAFQNQSHEDAFGY